MTYSSTLLSKKKLGLTKGNAVSFGISLGVDECQSPYLSCDLIYQPAPDTVNYTYFSFLSLFFFFKTEIELTQHCVRLGLPWWLRL